MDKFKIGDKAIKPKGYDFPCTIVGVFKTLKGETRVVGEMDDYGLLHIFNENQLEHVISVSEKDITKNANELITLLESQIMDLSVMSKIELGDDVIEEIKRLKDSLKQNG